MLNNFQIQLAHQQAAVPLTRDYITEADGQFAGPAAERPGLVELGAGQGAWRSPRSAGLAMKGAA